MLFDDEAGATVIDEEDTEQTPAVSAAQQAPAPQPEISVGLALTAEDGRTQKVELTSKRPIVILGRDASCDLEIDDKRASRTHCQLIFDPETRTVNIEDLGSSNGTRINNLKITEAQQIQSGDLLRIGSTTFTIEIS